MHTFYFIFNDQCQTACQRTAADLSKIQNKNQIRI